MNLMQAIVGMYNHNDKAKTIYHTITFNGVTRTCRIGKAWNKHTGDWVYSIHESYCPPISYNEEQFIPALAGVSAIPLHFNHVDFKVSEAVIESV